VQFEHEVAQRRVVTAGDRRQTAAQLVVPDASLVHLRSFQVQVEFEPIRTPVRHSTRATINQSSLLFQ